MIPFPNKKYDIIYADPAWEMPNRRLGGGDISLNYSTMTMQEISDLPVMDIAKDDSLLFMWVVSLHLPKCIEIGIDWGFQYKTIVFNWHKQMPIQTIYTMAETEICLLFKRGKIPQPRGKHNIRQFLSCKRGSNSVKPLEIKHRITEMFPTQSKIELFARPSPLFKGLDDGWDYWGNEV